MRTRRTSCSRSPIASRRPSRSGHEHKSRSRAAPSKLVPSARLRGTQQVAVQRLWSSFRTKIKLPAARTARPGKTPWVNSRRPSSSQPAEEPPRRPLRARRRGDRERGHAAGVEPQRERRLQRDDRPCALREDLRRPRARCQLSLGRGVRPIERPVRVASRQKARRYSSESRPSTSSVNQSRKGFPPGADGSAGASAWPAATRRFLIFRFIGYEHSKAGGAVQAESLILIRNAKTS